MTYRSMYEPQVCLMGSGLLFLQHMCDSVTHLRVGTRCTCLCLLQLLASPSFVVNRMVGVLTVMPGTPAMAAGRQPFLSVLPINLCFKQPQILALSPLF